MDIEICKVNVKMLYQCVVSNLSLEC
jgi:hypothetical protein